MNSNNNNNKKKNSNSNGMSDAERVESELKEAELHLGNADLAKKRKLFQEKVRITPGGPEDNNSTYFRRPSGPLLSNYNWETQEVLASGYNPNSYKDSYYGYPENKDGNNEEPQVKRNYKSEFRMKIGSLERCKDKAMLEAEAFLFDLGDTIGSLASENPQSLKFVLNKTYNSDINFNKTMVLDMGNLRSKLVNLGEGATLITPLAELLSIPFSRSCVPREMIFYYLCKRLIQGAERLAPEVIMAIIKRVYAYLSCWTCSGNIHPRKCFELKFGSSGNICLFMLYLVIILLFIFFFFFYLTSYFA